MKLNPIYKLFQRRFSSIPLENSAILLPFMEFASVLKNQSVLKANLALRQMDLDLPSLLCKYEIYQKLDTEKKRLIEEKDRIPAKLKLLQGSNKDSSVAEQTKEEGKNLRDKLKTLKEQLHSVENDFIHEFLKLPNNLHDKTPSNECTLLYRDGLPTPSSGGNKKICHLLRKDQIDYRDSTCYYLKKEAAKFDFNLPINCVRHFLAKNYTQFVNPDFIRTVLLEAAATDSASVELVAEESRESQANLLHLTGGGSMLSFLGFIAKLSIFPSLLPLRFVSSGREYSVCRNSTYEGLYAATQTNAVQTLIIAENGTDIEQEFENALGLTIDIFREFKIHFRIVYVPANELNVAESLRASIQMFSPVYDAYIDVGHLSNYSNYLSKRLLFNFKDKKDFKFPYIAAGPVMNITRVLACLLENGHDLNYDFTQKNKDAVKTFNNLFST